MKPIVYGLQEKYSDRINFALFELSDPDTLFIKKDLGLQSVPHFFLLDSQGNILKQWIGPVAGGVLSQAFESALSQ